MEEGKESPSLAGNTSRTRSNDLQRASTAPSIHRKSPSQSSLLTSNRSPSHSDSFLQKNHLGSLSSLQHLTVQCLGLGAHSFLPLSRGRTSCQTQRRGTGGGGQKWGVEVGTKVNKTQKPGPLERRSCTPTACWLGRGLYTLTPSSAFSSASQPTPSTGREGDGGGR